jgi:hypothetical protein
MPGTNDRVIFHLAFGQGPAPVIAGIINGVVAPPEIKDGEAPARDVYPFGLAWCKVVCPSHLDKYWHGFLPSEL